MWDYKTKSFFNNRLELYRTRPVYFEISITITSGFIGMQLGWFGFDLKIF